MCRLKKLNYIFAKPNKIIDFYTRIYYNYSLVRKRQNII
jgi:hypothetical protein